MDRDADRFRAELLPFLQTLQRLLQLRDVHPHSGQRQSERDSVLPPLLRVESVRLRRRFLRQSPRAAGLDREQHGLCQQRHLPHGLLPRGGHRAWDVHGRGG